MVAAGCRSQRSQSLVEFAIVAPLLLVLLFAVVDFGRVIYIYVTLNQAVNEGARSAIKASPLLPTNADVETAVRRHAVDVVLANPCPNGPITAAKPPAGQGWIFITEPNPPTTVEALSPTLAHAPGGPMGTVSTSPSRAHQPALHTTPPPRTGNYQLVPIP